MAFSLHSFLGKAAIEQIIPEALLLILVALFKRSKPVAFIGSTTHLLNAFGAFSPLGAITFGPNSTTSATRLLPATAGVPLQMPSKFGATLGAPVLITSPAKVKANPSTDPSGIFTVGPVIAVVHLLSPGFAW